MRLSSPFLLVLIITVWYQAEADQKFKESGKTEKPHEKIKTRIEDRFSYVDNIDDEYEKEIYEAVGDDYVEVVYIVSTSEGNVSGILLTETVVVSMANPGSNPRLCQLSTCNATSLAKETNLFNYWVRTKGPQKIMPTLFDSSRFDDEPCYANYEGTKMIVSAEKPKVRINCLPPCKYGDVLVCTGMAAGIVFGDPPQLYTMADLLQDYSLRKGETSGPSSQLRDDTKKAEGSGKLRSSDSGTDGVTASIALIIFALFSMIPLSFYIR